MGAAATTAISNSGEVNVPKMIGSQMDYGRMIMVLVTGSGSYATGGDTLDLSQWFPQQVYRGFFVQFGTGQPQNYMAILSAGATPQTNLMHVWSMSGGAEANNATNLSGVQWLLLAWGC